MVNSLIFLISLTCLQQLVQGIRRNEDSDDRNTWWDSGRRRPTRRNRNRLGNGNSFADEFNLPECEGYFHLWENPSIPNEERNAIGRAIFQTPEKMEQAKALITQGKVYNLGFDYTNDLVLGFGRIYEIETICSGGACQTGVTTNAIGNSGTQMDGLGHFYVIDTDTNEYVWFNNLRFNGTEGYKEVGIEKLPLFFTRGILLDVADYLNLDVLPDNYTITTADILGTLNYQGLSQDDLEFGDVVMIYTGWAVQHFDNQDVYYNGNPPGISIDTVRDVFYDSGVMIIGADNYGIEDVWNYPVRGFPTHVLWIVCSGGLFHESMRLQEWVQDARQGLAPYMGAYIFKPLPIETGAGGAGAAQLIV